MRPSQPVLPIFAACALAASTACSQQATRPNSPLAKSVFQYRDLEVAWRVAQQKRIPMLVFVSMNRCAHCDRMERETYAHPQISRGIYRRFVTVKLKREQAPKVVKKLGVRAYPTTLVISTGGDLMARMEGFVEPKKFAEQIRPVLAQQAKTGGRTARKPPTRSGESAATK